MGRRLDQFDQIADGDLLSTDFVIGYRPGDKGIRFEAQALGTFIGSTALVTSVFGRAGDVTAQAGDYSAGDITGLGGAATLNVGTTAGTVAAGDHGHTTLTMNSLSLVCAADASVHVLTIVKDPDTGIYTLDISQ